MSVAAAVAGEIEPVRVTLNRQNLIDRENTRPAAYRRSRSHYT
ncbi:MAG: hypothetical protein AAF283_09580 [Cyanobacteria bacterium P01_A01_bin.70]